MIMMIIMITMKIKLQHYDSLSAQCRQILACKYSVIQGFYVWYQMFKECLALAIGLIALQWIPQWVLVVIIQCIMIYSLDVNI